MRQAQYVADLRRKDGQSDTCREAYDDRIGDELDDDAQPESTKRDENDACQNSGNQQALQTVFRVVDNAVDDDDKGSCRASNLHFCAAEQGDEETSHNGRYNALFRGYTAGYAESDGKWQSNDAHDDASHQVFHEGFAAITLHAADNSWCQSFHVCSNYAAKVQQIEH